MQKYQLGDADRKFAGMQSEEFWEDALGGELPKFLIAFRGRRNWMKSR